MSRHMTKLIREGDYVAEVDIAILDDDGPGAPYLSLADARRLDEVRAALRRGDFEEAQRTATLYRLSPVPSYSDEAHTS